LINRKRPFTREFLIDLLWGNVSPAKGKKYLRDTLWRLQSECDSQLNLPLDTILVMENEWIYVHLQADVWIDVYILEQAFKVATTIPEFDLKDEHTQDLATAIMLYTGDLMEGWYQDWCILERERLLLIYLSAIDRLMVCFEARHRYEEGILHGLAGLRYDWARERTHRRLMRLYYLSGDRTAALRQYQQCQSILKSEFNVHPEPKTAALYDQICKGQPIHRTAEQSRPATVAPNIHTLLPNLLEALHTLKNILAVTNPQSDLGHQSTLATELNPKINPEA
jgi:DNA-binding SARP family transcriptional activator